MFAEWAAISDMYKGFTLDEIKEMSKRERTNWLNLGKARYGRTGNG